jgi:muramidase (phage lysozyme)
MSSRHLDQVARVWIVGTIAAIASGNMFSCGSVSRSSDELPVTGAEGPAAGPQDEGVTAVSARPAPASNIAVTADKATRALLDTIAFAEGTNSRYDIIFSFKSFSSFLDHPRRVICSGGYCSDAAGRYQFLSTTWDEARAAIGVRDFQPPSQDKAAIHRIEVFRGASEHRNRLTRSQFERLVYKIAPEWASLPGSPYGQPTKSMSAVWNVYQESLSK